MEPSPVRKGVSVPASLHEVWQAWTTADGAKSFFAPEAAIELRIGGRYELLFDLEMPAGLRGAEGLQVLCFLPEELLAFEWNAPPQFPAEREQKTWVVVQLRESGPRETHVRLTHLGWREGGRWSEVHAYFERAWDIVLGRLRYRFSCGPIDGSNPWRPAGEPAPE